MKNVKKLMKEWERVRGKPRLMRIPGSALHARPETVESIMADALTSGRPVGAILREDIELARRLRVEASRDPALRRFLESE